MSEEPRMTEEEITRAYVEALMEDLLEEQYAREENGTPVVCLQCGDTKSVRFVMRINSKDKTIESIGKIRCGKCLWEDKLKEPNG